MAQRNKRVFLEVKNGPFPTSESLFCMRLDECLIDHFNFINKKRRKQKTANIQCPLVQKSERYQLFRNIPSCDSTQAQTFML